MKQHTINLCLLLLCGLTVGFLAVKIATSSSGPESAAGQNAARSGAAEPLQTRATRTHAPKPAAGPQRDTVGNPRDTLEEMARIAQAGMLRTRIDYYAEPTWRGEIVKMLDWMEQEDVIDALEQLDEVTTDRQLSFELRVMLVQHLARMDGQHAMEYTLSMPREPHGSIASSWAYDAWVTYDPGNALTWMQDYTLRNPASLYGKKQTSFARLAAQKLCEIDIQQGYARHHEVSHLYHGGRAMPSVNVPQYRDVNLPQYRDEVIQALPYLQGQTKYYTMRELVDRWAEDDPQAAASFVESRDLRHDKQDSVREGLASGWAMQDPQGALDWLGNHPPNGINGEDAAMLLVYSAWLRYWPDEAQAWLQGTEPALRESFKDVDPEANNSARLLADVMRTARKKAEEEAMKSP